MEETTTHKILRNDDGYSTLCQPCGREGDFISAEGYCVNCNEFFCTSCLKFHRKMAITKCHVIKTEEEMPDFKSGTDSCSEACETHKTEIINYYCKEHDSVACRECIAIDHKTCDVQMVSEVTGDHRFDKDQFFKQTGIIIQKINDIQGKVFHVEKKIKYSLQNEAKKKAEIVEEIKHFRNEINDSLDKAVAKLLKEINEIHERSVDTKEKLLKDVNSMGIDLILMQGRFDKYAGKIYNLFVTHKLFDKKLLKIKKDISNFERLNARNNGSLHFKFVPSKELQAVMKTVSPIGSLSVYEEMKKCLFEMNAHFVKKVLIERKNNVESWITGMAMNSNNELLLTDYYGSSLIKLNVNTNKIIARNDLISRPWDVTSVDRGNCAVTSPDEGSIVILKTINGLEKCKEMEVRNNCRGIDYFDDNLAVSFSSPAAVQILNMNGDVLHEFRDNKNIFSFPGHIAWCKLSGNVYVSDCSNRKVVELTKDMELETVYQSNSMKWPRGLTVVSDGTIVVCNETNNEILNLIVPDKMNCRNSAMHLSNLNKPMSVVICEESKRMFISSSSPSAIIIFDLKCIRSFFILRG